MIRSNACKGVKSIADRSSLIWVIWMRCLGVNLRKWRNCRVRLMNSGIFTKKPLKSRKNNWSIWDKMANRLKSKVNPSKVVMISINKGLLNTLMMLLFQSSERTGFRFHRLTIKPLSLWHLLKNKKTWKTKKVYRFLNSYKSLRLP